MARDERGASSVEYGLVVTAIAALIVIVLLALGGVTRDMFSSSCTAIDSRAATGATCSP